MADSTRPHILAINNSDDVLKLFRDLLEEEGYRVSTHAYVDKDLDALCELRPDLIILDYMWAAEDSGWALLQMIKMNPKTSAIPMILCTGAVKQVRDLEGHLANMSVRVVLKPFDIDQLLQAIRAGLEGTPAPPAPEHPLS